MRAPRTEKAIWIILDDPPGETTEELTDLMTELQIAVNDVAGKRVNRNRSPEPRCEVSAGVAESAKLRVFQQGR